MNYNYAGGNKNQVSNITDAISPSWWEYYITNGFKQNANLTGTTGGYTYDANGNMVHDYHKGMTITYNYLNLPQSITFDGTGANGVNGAAAPTGSIYFTYDATGKKWRKISSDGTTTNTRDYIDGVEYKNGAPDIINFGEGYAQYDASTTGNYSWQGWVYKYALKDHLGNTRVVFSDKDDNGVVGVTDIEQVNNYYPFGMNMDGPWNGAKGAYKYQYNGKELNDDLGLNWLTYGFRFYDPIVSRFWSVDPLANKFQYLTPYQYASNNPIKYIDLDGLEGILPPILLGASDPLISLPETAVELGNRITESPVDENISSIPKMEDHHIITRELKDNTVVKEARNEGFKYDGKENKIDLEKFDRQTGEGRHGNHPDYSAELKKAMKDFEKENPNRTGKESLDFVRGKVQEVKDLLNQNPTKKVNDLFKPAVVPIDNTRVVRPVMIQPVPKNPTIIL